MATNKTLVEKIIEKATIEASEIVQAGQNKAAQLLDDTLALEKRDYDRALLVLSKSLEDAKSSLTVELEQLEKKRLLLKKKTLMQSVLLDALKQMQSFTPTQLKAWLKTTLDEISLSGDETIEVNPQEESLYAKTFSSLPTSKPVMLDLLGLKKSKIVLKLGTTTAIKPGGFILSGKNYDLNFSYSRLLSLWLESNEAKLAKILFK